MSSLRLRPHAKINLGLRILGRRPDGFHEIRTRFQTIDLTDELILEKTPSELTLRVEGADIPADDSNLVLKAARLLREGRKDLPGASMLLRKRIPSGAGLGGGSSDAAATLLGLNELWRLGMKDQDLLPLAARLGSDVPFFVKGGSALGTGRGEHLSALPSPTLTSLLLVLPDVSCSTPEIYRLWDEQCGSRRPIGALHRESPTERDPQNDPDPTSVQNDLEAAVLGRHPRLGRIKERLIEVGAVASALSGSGPSMYGLFKTRSECLNAAAQPEWGPDRALACGMVGSEAYRKDLGVPLSH